MLCKWYQTWDSYSNQYVKHWYDCWQPVQQIDLGPVVIIGVVGLIVLGFIAIVKGSGSGSRPEQIDEEADKILALKRRYQALAQAELAAAQLKTVRQITATVNETALVHDQIKAIEK